MWSGQIVPLLKPLGEPSLVYKPLATRESHASHDDFTNRRLKNIDEEEMLLPLPEDLCFGTGIRNGSSVHVAYLWNPPIIHREEKKNYDECEKWLDMWFKRYSHDVAAWIVVSPFPIELLTKNIMHLVVRLTNQAGAFYHAVTKPVTKQGGVILQIEGMATGDEGSLILFPESKDGFVKKIIKRILDES